jgi:hypothetical protein
MIRVKNKEQLVKNGETWLNRRARTLALKSLESALDAVDPNQIIESKIFAQKFNLILSDGVGDPARIHLNHHE